MSAYIIVPCNVPNHLLLKDSNCVESFTTDKKVNNYKKFIDYETINVDDLPDSISLSTISCSGSFNVIIDLDNMLRYIKLSPNGIISMKYNNILKWHDDFVKKKKKSNNCFENQATMDVRVNYDKEINLKVFQNGSFQMTGCKSIYDCNIVLNKLYDTITTTFGIIDNFGHSKSIEPFAKLKIMDNNNNVISYEHVTDENKHLIKVIDFHPDTINVVFYKNFHINRAALYDTCFKKGYMARYEPNIHPSVNIRCPLISHTNKKGRVKNPAILVFSSGKIMISGTKSIDEVVTVRDFMAALIDDNINELVDKSPDKILGEKEIQDIIDEMDDDLELVEYDDDEEFA